MMSINGKVLCKPYTGKKSLQTKVRSGLAEVIQKSQLIGLQVVAKAKLPSGDILEVGQTIFFAEADLMNFGVFRDVKNCPEIEGDFVAAPSELIVCVK